ncbi:MAG: RusA family crossover junction endodeoxyribonuclease [Euryarchaeota archaeon]|nr:RusA family crossover junction endodeoxyribonuclease [Euryarchaeota archaeon]
MVFVVEVRGIPPYKQAPADVSERRNQQERKAILKHQSEEALRGIGAKFDKDERLGIWVSYRRKKGRADAANIIGGIADTLQGLVYSNDHQLRQIHYEEQPGEVDGYTVKVSVLDG